MRVTEPRVSRVRVRDASGALRSSTHASNRFRTLFEESIRFLILLFNIWSLDMEGVRERHVYLSCDRETNQGCFVRLGTVRRVTRGREERESERKRGRDTSLASLVLFVDANGVPTRLDSSSRIRETQGDREHSSSRVERLQQLVAAFRSAVFADFAVL